MGVPDTVRQIGSPIPKIEVCSSEDRISRAVPLPNTAADQQLRRASRRRELLRCSGWQLASIIIDYGVMLTEDCDPVEVILDCEFALPPS